MFSKIATGLVAFLAAASAVSSLVVPQSLAQLDAISSTTTSITLTVNVSFTADQADAGRVIAFTFGSADGTLSFGSGTFTVPLTLPPSGSANAIASGVYSPQSAAAKAAGEVVLSNYAANLAGAVSVVAADGTFLNVPLAAPGVEIIQRLYLVVTVATILSGVGNVQLGIYNAFTLPLTFQGINATAVTPLISNVPTQFGNIVQDPLPTPIVVNGTSFLRTPNITAAVTLTLAQGLNLISRLAGGATINVTSNATARVLVGQYPTVVTLTNKVIPGQSA